MSDVSSKRLLTERKDWRREHPQGFSAKFAVEPGKSAPNMYKWICKIPGKPGGSWAGGEYTLTMDFPLEYPARPPKCKFTPVLFHPNIYPSGTVCLSILNEEEDWKPSITIKQILLGIQDLLEHPNIASPAQMEPYLLYQSNKKDYLKRVRHQALSMAPQGALAPPVAASSASSAPSASAAVAVPAPPTVPAAPGGPAANTAAAASTAPASTIAGKAPVPPAPGQSASATPPQPPQPPSHPHKPSTASNSSAGASTAPLDRREEKSRENGTAS